MLAATRFRGFKDLRKAIMTVVAAYRDEGHRLLLRRHRYRYQLPHLQHFLGRSFRYR